MATLTGSERYRTNTQSLGWSEERADENVGDTERLLSGLMGGGLLAAALMRRGLSGAVLAVLGASLLQRSITGHCMLYEALGANTASTDGLGRRKVPTSRAVKAQQRIRIERPPEELYRFWRNVENLPRIMSDLESVHSINDRLSHWVVKAIPMGGPTIEWDAEIISEVDGELIGWRSLRGSDVDHAGSVRFERTSDGRGTDVTVTLQYAPPGGLGGTLLAKMLGEDPEWKIQQDLQRFKETMEAQSYSPR
jgi:uncharacterized membrane protein